MPSRFVSVWSAAAAYLLAAFFALAAPLHPEAQAREPEENEPAPTDGSIGTTLLRLRWHSFDLGAHGFQNAGSGTAIATRGDRVLVAEPSGRFFEARLTAEGADVRLLPLRIETNYAAIRRHSEVLSRGVADSAHRDRFVGVTGLLFLGDGETLAAAHTYWNDDEKCVTIRVAVTRIGEEWSAAAGEWRTIFVSRPCVPVDEDTNFLGQQAGGRLAEVRPGVLYLTTGEFAFDGVVNPRVFSQDPKTSYGKIIEIDVASGKHRTVSVGHRNPQGLLVDRKGRIWATEHGPKGGDELNLIREGANYGWPRVTLGTDYGSYVWGPSSEQGRHDEDEYEAPVLAWLPSQAPSNLVEVRGFAPEWEGDLLVAFLLGNRLGRIRLDGERVVYEEPIRIGERVRDIASFDGGRVVLWTDAAKLILLSPDPTESLVARMVDSMPDDLRSVVAECATCHVLDAPSAGGRISLWGVYRRKAAAGDRALFSEALRTKGGEWFEEALDAFLENPARAVPGTTMEHAGIPDPSTRAAVIDFLKKLN